MIRRARAHTTCAQHDSTRGKVERKTTVKIYGCHQGDMETIGREEKMYRVGGMAIQHATC